MEPKKVYEDSFQRKDKRKKILEYFGGLEQLQCAKISDIERVPGIGRSLAKRIYDTLHMK